MKILDNQTLKFGQAKFLDLVDKVIIDTCFYDATSLDFLNKRHYQQYSTSVHNTSYGSSISCKNTSYNRFLHQLPSSAGTVVYFYSAMRSNMKSSIIDNLDSNIVYVIEGIGHHVINKYKRDTCELLCTLNLSSSYRISHQDDMYIYIYGDVSAFSITRLYSDSASLGGRVQVIKKSDLSVFSYSNQNGLVSYCGCSNNGRYSYYSSIKGSNGSGTLGPYCNIVIYDREQNVFTNLSSESVAANNHTSEMLNYLDMEDAIVEFSVYSSSNATIGYRFISKDESLVSTSVSSLLLSNYKTVNPDDTTQINTSSNCSNILFVTKSEEKIYLNIYTYASHALSSAGMKNRIVTYEITVNQGSRLISLTYKGYCEFDGTGKNPLFSESSEYKTVYVPTVNYLDVVKFDSVKEYYVLDRRIAGNVPAIGEDHLGRIWYCESSGQLNMISESDNDKINIVFSDSNITYNGVDIETSIKVNCYRAASDTYISTNVELILDGNFVFKDTGLKKAVVETSSQGDLTIPIIIKGPGMLYIYPKVVVL